VQFNIQLWLCEWSVIETDVLRWMLRCVRVYTRKWNREANEPAVYVCSPFAKERGNVCRWLARSLLCQTSSTTVRTSVRVRVRKRVECVRKARKKGGVCVCAESSGWWLTFACYARRWLLLVACKCACVCRCVFRAYRLRLMIFWW
jgi:hypothetical protein